MFLVNKHSCVDTIRRILTSAVFSGVMVSDLVTCGGSGGGGEARGERRVFLAKVLGILFCF